MMTGGQALAAYLAEQASTLRKHAEGVRAGEEEAIHDSRVASRRIRGALRVYRRLVRRDRVEALVDELRWHGQQLGPVRDGQVERALLEDHLAQLSEDQRQGPVVERLATGLQQRHDVSVRRMARALGVRRQEALIQAVERLAANPPLRGRAKRPAVEVMPRMLHRAQQRVSRERDTLRALDLPEREAHWHEVRKKAKAARYGAEVLIPVVGDAAAQQTTRWQAVTSALGDVQDARLARVLLANLSREAERAGESTFTYGVLHEQERQDVEESIVRAREACDRALAVDPRGWQRRRGG